MVNFFFITYDFSGIRTHTNELLGYLLQRQDIAVYRVFLEREDYKEHTVVCEANIVNIQIPFVKREPSSVKEYAAGDGNFEEALAHMESSWGNIDESSKLYQIATIGVIRSIYEQCSYVALEMMQHGLPKVVYEAPGLSELFTDNHNALIVSVHKSTKDLMEAEIGELQLAEALEASSNNNVLRQKLSGNAKIQWEQHHAAENMGERTIKQYEKQLQNKPTKGRRAES